MPLLSCEGCVKDLFVSEVEFINRFTGQQLWGWGCNTYGTIGDNSITCHSSPVQTISGGTDWKMVSGNGTIASGGGVSAGIKTDGTLWTWGRGTYGRLGNGSVTVSSPIQTVSGGTNWLKVAAGVYNVGAIKTDGTLWMWGGGAGGRLGNNDNVTCHSSPVQTFSGGTNWKSLSIGMFSAAAIKTDGTLWTWGADGSLGLMGDGTVISRSSPVQTVSGGTNWKQVSVACRFVSATKTDGTLWLWGFSNNGQLGNDLGTFGASSPIQTISGGTNWKSTSAGRYNVAAIKTDGSLWVWGSNFSGTVGDNTATPRSSPVQTVSAGTNWLCVHLAESAVAFGIKTDGTLWSWGAGSLGRLGNNTSSTNVSSPVQIRGNSWRSVSGGRHALALRTEE